MDETSEYQPPVGSVEEQPSGGLATKASPSTSETTAAAAAPQEKLRPELQRVADQHGLELTLFCLRVAGANQAVDQMQALARRNHWLRPQVAVLTDSLAYIADAAIKGNGWDWTRISECLGAIGASVKVASHLQLVNTQGEPLTKQ